MNHDYILEMNHITKKYPGVTALDGVDLKVRRNTVHCLVGENGAGKSTLIKIITCAVRMTGGEMLFDGRPFHGRTVRDAMRLGISTVFQELNIVNQLTVEENLTLGCEDHTLGVIRKNRETPVFAMLEEFAPDIPYSRPVSMLSYADKQIVEIVKAAGTEAKLVIMDEPTAALSRAETLRLYDVVKKLKSKGITVIFISHILDDIFAIGDEVTVLRDGNRVGTRLIKETSRDDLIKLMVGKVVHSGYRPGNKKPGTILLEAEGVTTASVKNLSFNLRKGEILGFYGLRGAGKSETARALFGLDRIKDGRILVDGNPVRIRNPEEAMAKGLAMVPEERLSEGLFMKMPVSDNIAITNLKKSSRYCIVNDKDKKRAALKYAADMNIKMHSVSQKAGTLSGGNQQKVVIAKCLNAKTRILLLDEPSRGIDVGSKEEIYAIIRNLAQEGVGVIVFSSEYDEMANLCDRVAILVGGSIASIMDHGELDQQKIHILTMGKGA